MPSLGEKVTKFNAFAIRQTVEFFTPAEFWLPNSNFRGASRMLGLHFPCDQIFDIHFLYIFVQNRLPLVLLAPSLGWEFEYITSFSQNTTRVEIMLIIRIENCTNIRAEVFVILYANCTTISIFHNFKEKLPIYALCGSSTCVIVIIYGLYRYHFFLADPWVKTSYSSCLRGFLITILSWRSCKCCIPSAIKIMLMPLSGGGWLGSEDIVNVKICHYHRTILMMVLGCQLIAWISSKQK